jgi:hypothetical protein
MHAAMRSESVTFFFVPGYMFCLYRGALFLVDTGVGDSVLVMKHV